MNDKILLYRLGRNFADVPQQESTGGDKGHYDLAKWVNR